MKKKGIYFGIILLAILIQTSFEPVFAPAHISGNVVLMLVLAMAVLEGFSSSLTWAIVAGILFDFASYGIVGQHVMIFLLIFYGVSFFSRRLSVDVKGTGLLLLLLFVIASTFVSRGMLAGFVFLQNRTVDYWQVFGSLNQFIFQIGYNVFLFSLWFNVVKKIRKMSL
jgi:rod shape-determining protein MreD